MGIIKVRFVTLPLSWASYQIRKIIGCACAGNAGNVFPIRRLQRKPLVSDPGMHHGTCVTHVSWCMSGSLTCGGGENVPGIPGACATAILRIWQDAHYSGSVCVSRLYFVNNNWSGVRSVEYMSVGKRTLHVDLSSMNSRVHSYYNSNPGMDWLGAPITSKDKMGLGHA